MLPNGDVTRTLEMFPTVSTTGSLTSACLEMNFPVSSTAVLTRRTSREILRVNQLPQTRILIRGFNQHWR